MFPQRPVDAPSALGLPPGTQLLMDAVPTSVALGPDGAFYVSELTDFPFPVEGARIYRVVPGEEPQVYAEGFTNAHGSSSPAKVVRPTTKSRFLTTIAPG